MGIHSTVWSKFKVWYRGVYVPPPENDPNSHVVFIGPGVYVQPRFARFFNAIAGFYRRHWQWAWSTIIGIIGLAPRYASIRLAHSDSE